MVASQQQERPSTAKHYGNTRHVNFDLFCRSQKISIGSSAKIHLNSVFSVTLKKLNLLGLDLCRTSMLFCM